MSDTPRLYGAPDDADRHPPTEQGMRGERSGARDPSQPPRTFEGEDGRPITVQVTSGTADISPGQSNEDDGAE